MVRSNIVIDLESVVCFMLLLLFLRCLMCGREVARKQSSTWAMMSHLKSFHKDIDLSIDPSGNQETDGIPLSLICIFMSSNIYCVGEATTKL